MVRLAGRYNSCGLQSLAISLSVHIWALWQYLEQASTKNQGYNDVEFFMSYVMDNYVTCHGIIMS